jgi:5-methyltetrahydrofolate corrinoid/iron sulfur protein methyltransferase
MLARYGLYAAIADALDAELIQMARGHKPEIVSLIHKAMDGDTINMASLNAEEIKYVKTVKVLTGEALYSNAWLE